MLDSYLDISYYGQRGDKVNRHVRIRCPICGMLGWQSRFAKEFDFEVIIHEIGSKGRGRITNKYYPPEHEDGVWILKLAMIEKMEAALKKLRSEVGEERAAAYQEKVDVGEYLEAASTLVLFHADFEMYASLVVDDEVEVIRTPSLVVRPGKPVQVIVPGDTSAVQIVTYQTGAEEEDGVEGVEMLSQPYHKARPRPRMLHLASLVERKNDTTAHASSVLEEVNEDEEWTEVNSEIEKG